MTQPTNDAEQQMIDIGITASGDNIDAVVDESLTHAPTDDNRPDYSKCKLCKQDWHGLPNAHCPSEYVRCIECDEKPEYKLQIGADIYSRKYVCAKHINDVVAVMSGRGILSLTIDVTRIEL